MLGVGCRSAPKSSGTWDSRTPGTARNTRPTHVPRPSTKHGRVHPVDVTYPVSRWSFRVTRVEVCVPERRLSTPCRRRRRRRHRCLSGGPGSKSSLPPSLRGDTSRRATVATCYGSGVVDVGGRFSLDVYARLTGVESVSFPVARDSRVV